MKQLYFRKVPVHYFESPFEDRTKFPESDRTEFPEPAAWPRDHLHPWRKLRDFARASLVGFALGQLMARADPYVWIALGAIGLSLFLFDELWPPTRPWRRLRIGLGSMIILGAVAVAYALRDQPPQPRYSLAIPEEHAQGAKVTVTG